MRRHKRQDVKLVSAEEIVYAPRWVHRLADSPVESEITLHDGTLIRGPETGVVFNRLQRVDMPQFAPADREYALMEMHALILSWLLSLPCPVINAPAPQGLAGADRSPLAWQYLAAKAGLPCKPGARVDDYRFSALAAGERVRGPLSAELHEGCVELARSAGVELLRLWFGADWGFAGASPMPAVISASELDAVIELLESRAAGAL